MTINFKTIGIFAKTSDSSTCDSVLELVSLLKKHNRKVIVEKETLENLKANSNSSDLVVVDKSRLGLDADLIIVIGGDGSLLNAARSIVNDNKPIIGVHKGKLGFLADISPDNMCSTIEDVLDGKYELEHRTLLEVTTSHPVTSKHLALNDVVIYNGDVARMIEFEVYIDDKYMLHQRSDGLIISTPTGSTAYSLSGGGPIIYPTIHAVTLVPMFPHTLSARPIVIPEESNIKIVLTEDNTSAARISCDGQIHFSIHPGNSIEIASNANKLKLLHPKNYDYFAVLREKLGWNYNTTSNRFPPKSN